MSDAQEEPSTGRRRSASVRFVEQYLRPSPRLRQPRGPAARPARRVQPYRDDVRPRAMRGILRPLHGQAARPSCRRARRSSAVGAALRRFARFRLDAGHHGRRRCVFGGAIRRSSKSAAIGFSSTHARYRRVPLARRRRSDAVSPRRAGVERRAREGARVRHLSARCGAAAGRAVELRDRAYARHREGQLEVYFQPKVEIATNRRVCGVEALVRWRTDSGNFVPASDFIPLAETNGAIVPLTWLVFDRIVAHSAVDAIPRRSPWRSTSRRRY